LAQTAVETVDNPAQTRPRVLPTRAVAVVAVKEAQTVLLVAAVW